MQTHTDTQRRALDISEVAAWMGISRSAAYELAGRDALPVPVIRAGRRLLVSRAALEAVFPTPATATVADDDSAA